MIAYKRNISKALLSRIPRQANITKGEWENLELKAIACSILGSRSMYLGVFF